MANNLQPVSLEFSSDSDSDCYIINSGSEVEICSADDTEPEAVGPMDPVPDDDDDEMFEVSEFEYGSSIGEEAEIISSDDEKDDTKDDEKKDDICDFCPDVPDKIV